MALRAGRWAEAREVLRRDVEREPAPDALFGLGVAEWWLGRVEESLRLWEQAFVGSSTYSVKTPAGVRTLPESLPLRTLACRKHCRCL